MPDKKDNDALSLNDFLIAEYGFISNTILESRDSEIPKSVINFDITALIGTVIAILGNRLNFDANSYSLINILFIVFFLWLWIRGMATVIQIAHLRNAWHESMLALSHIKDVYMQHFPDSSKAIRWKTSTLPPKLKIGSASFILMAQVALFSSLAFGVSGGMLLFIFGMTSIIWIVLISLTLGVISFFFHISLYRNSLY